MLQGILQLDDGGLAIVFLEVLLGRHQQLLGRLAETAGEQSGHERQGQRGAIHRGTQTLLPDCSSIT
ncbi:hypothetical protein RQP53_01580 [Paucibacter sp. APW11]|uniref:Uncharacterized protein n=1 Tax=Roseateles aquae TaxID=3077235 RepID=A0ABU3P5V7_9BURK|nr:hypothetical protein [Paucibacter sp. APW11]MDT8997960.1 hypothetical protein [Paucibacter sp. APW11]